ncbi:3-keto-5-aminohexanoate cleavage protein [Streptomyces sp. NPDC056503]|uniref:3-keto-5-aminohexanoate cleavage protein n=1 Tax=Streptomyces sp. NPDC056503 TaxID=3345842 RepID=UPI0036BBDA58
MVPRDPAGLAGAAADAVAAGAREVRIRPRTPCGGGSLSPRVVEPALTAVRGAVRVPVVVAADAWAEPDPERRSARIRSWETLPDLAWVAWHEPGAEETAAALLARGVAVEAGLRAGTAGPALFARSPLAARVRRIVAEVPDPVRTTAPNTATGSAEAKDPSAPKDPAGATDPARATGSAEAAGLTWAADPAWAAGPAGGVEAWARALAGGSVPVLLCGTGAAAWPSLRLARRLGLAGRIGLEDTLYLPDGTRARSSAEQVRAASAGLR